MMHPSKEPINVTDHAICRYLERAYGFNVEAIREHIAGLCAVSGPFANLPRGHYGVILVDPPWRFEAWSKNGDERSAQQHYSTMDVQQMVRLPILDLAAKDCVLFCWATWPHLKSALWLISAWGFTYKTCAFDWMKADPYCLFADDATPNMGMGYWTRSNTEPCLLATRGKPKR
jgi:N6-adenosine-specific RNA methylase IME4